MQRYDPIPEQTNIVSGKIVDASYKVHSQLGPGLLESVYEVCLSHELRKIGLYVQTQLVVPVVYDNLTLDAALRLDMLVEDRVIVEVKAVDIMHPVFEAQLLSYLKLTRKRVGILINFNVGQIKDGIKRIVL